MSRPTIDRLQDHNIVCYMARYCGFHYRITDKYNFSYASSLPFSCMQQCIPATIFHLPWNSSVLCAMLKVLVLADIVLALIDQSQSILLEYGITLT
jgi:hypothetical protein